MDIKAQLELMQREYRQEADRLDEKIGWLTEKVVASSEETRSQFMRVDLQIQQLRDQLAATAETIQRGQVEQVDLAQTLGGRMRLLEERHGKMLGAVSTSLTELDERVKTLEK